MEWAERERKDVDLFFLSGLSVLMPHLIPVPYFSFFEQQSFFVWGKVGRTRTRSYLHNMKPCVSYALIYKH